MRLGQTGWEWVSALHDYAGEHPGSLSQWQQDFETSYYSKAVDYEEGTFISPKQLKELNKISEQLGLDQLDAEQFDED